MKFRVTEQVGNTEREMEKERDLLSAVKDKAATSSKVSFRVSFMGVRG